MITPPAHRPPLVVAVLAGGGSKRMGRDKAHMTAGVSKNSLLTLVCEAAKAAALPVVVVGRTPDDLPADMPTDCLAIPDLASDRGPLGGLFTALVQVDNADVLLCPCDIPHVTPDSFRWLTDIHQTLPDHHDGILPQWQGKDQPLFAIYKQSIRGAVKHLLHSENLAMKGLCNTADFLRVPLPPACAGAVQDWDTPADITS